MIHYIYKIVNNINNKIYIGYTSRKDPISRWNQHIKVSNRIDRPLYYAIRKYGSDNFTFSVIYCSTDNEHTLKTMESYFIEQYNSFITEWGYNLTRGGESNFGWQPTPVTRQVWSAQRKGRILSSEHRSKLSRRRKQFFIDNPEYRERYRQRALALGIRPPTPTAETNKKGAITRTGKHIHTQERKITLSNMFLTNSHPFQSLDLIEKRKQTWLETNRGKGEKNGNAVFCDIYDPANNLIGSGFLKSVCIDFNLPFNTLLATSRYGLPIQRGKWRGWRAVRISRACCAHPQNRTEIHKDLESSA